MITTITCTSSSIKIKCGIINMRFSIISLIITYYPSPTRAVRGMVFVRSSFATMAHSCKGQASAGTKKKYKQKKHPEVISQYPIYIAYFRS